MFDHTAPTIVSSDIFVINNSVNDSYASDGHTVELRIVSSEPIQVPTIAIGDQGVIVNSYLAAGASAGHGWNTYRYITSSDAEGVMGFTIDYLDLAGNSGTQATTTTNSSSITIDQITPTVILVSSSDQNGIYIVGDTISINVLLSETVVVAGIPQLQLETGTEDAVANYSYSSSSSNELIFHYIVASGESSLDLAYNSIDPLQLNDGMIQDYAENDADLSLGDPGSSASLSANNNLIIDGILPHITDVSSPAADGTYIIGDLIPIVVTFDDLVSVTGTPILLLETGIQDAEAYYASGSGQTTLTFNYIVGEGEIASDLDYTSYSALTDSAGAIVDENGNNADLNLPIPGTSFSLSTSSAIVIDGIVPEINMVTSSAPNGTYKMGDVIPISATFSEVVNVTGDPQLLLETGVNDAIAYYSGGTGTTVLSFSYTVAAGDTSPDLSYVNSQSLLLNGGTIMDTVGNNSNLTLIHPGIGNSLSAIKNLVVDGIAPSVEIVSAISADSSYGAGELLELTISFHEPVYVNGAGPQLVLAMGSAAEGVANYHGGGTGNRTLVMHYTVLMGDNSSDLDYSGTDALSFNNTTIRDIAGNDAELLLPQPGEIGSLSHNRTLIIDTVEPSTIYSLEHDFYNAASWGEDGKIQGYAVDSTSGVFDVEVRIQRNSDNNYYNGNGWLAMETWNHQHVLGLSSEATFIWEYYMHHTVLSNDVVYSISVRSTDFAGNMETTFAADSFHYDMEIPVSTVNMDAGFYSEFTWSDSSTISGSAMDSISGVTAVKILIFNEVDSSWWDGSLWTQEPSWLNAVGAETWAYGLNNENLNDGVSYHIFSQARDAAGNMQSDSGLTSFIYDMSGPSTGQATDGSESVDQDWTNNINAISASWSGFIDSTVGIAEFEVGIGSSSGESDVLDWISVGLDTHYTNQELTLQHGQTYHFSVRARDYLNNVSSPGISDGLTVDTAPPVIHDVFEGSLDDPDFQSEDSSLTLSWDAVDDLSGIISFSYTVGTNPGDADVVPWVHNWSDTTTNITGLSLENGTTYWGSVAAFDSAGNNSVFTGNGITIDRTPPETGLVLDISDLNMLDDQAYTPSQTTLMASWSGFEDSISGIASYEYAVVSTGTFLVDWSSVGLNTTMIDSTFLLLDGRAYYTIVRAIDGVGNVSNDIGTDGIIADHSGPFGDTVIDGDSTDLDGQNSAVTYQGAWDMFTDELSGIDGHEYALYDLTDSLYYTEWHYAGIDTVVILDGLNLVEDHTYELHVRAIDQVGNIGEIISSDGVLIDLTSPAVPGNLVGRFSSQRIELTWEPVADEDIDHYRIYAGTDSNNTVPILDAFTSIAEAFMPEFQDDETYYFSISAQDYSGNESDRTPYVHGIPRHAVITHYSQDTLGTLFRDDKVIKLRFSQPLISSGYPTMNSVVYENMNLAVSYADSDTTLTLTILETLASLDTIILAIPGIIDWAGDSVDEKQLTYHTYLL